MQTRLVTLGYLPTSAVTGTYDYRTMQAVLAFQAWSGLQRDGIVGPMTQAKLKTAGRPLPLDRTSKGRRVEIYRARGVVLLVNSGGRVRAIHTSTGVGGDSPDTGTPPGKWKIYRKELKSWSVPYKTWLPYAAYWVGGWALHGYADGPRSPPRTAAPGFRCPRPSTSTTSSRSGRRCRSSSARRRGGAPRRWRAVRGGSRGARRPRRARRRVPRPSPCPAGR